MNEVVRVSADGAEADSNLRQGCEGAASGGGGLVEPHLRRVLCVFTCGRERFGHKGELSVLCDKTGMPGGKHRAVRTRGAFACTHVNTAPDANSAYVFGRGLDHSAAM
eukprot:Rhum_TRINITY_DN14307_c1_g1::Rhum_TRINITY_DN14307_c1_g1_i3::g.79723::m.79723